MNGRMNESRSEANSPVFTVDLAVRMINLRDNQGHMTLRPVAVWRIGLENGGQLLPHALAEAGTRFLLEDLEGTPALARFADKIKAGRKSTRSWARPKLKRKTS